MAQSCVMLAKIAAVPCTTRTETFHEELVALLRKHGVEFNEKDLLD